MASRKILFTAAGIKGTIGQMTAMPPGTLGHQHTRKDRNQKQQSCLIAAVFENKKTEQNVHRYLLEISLLQIYVEGSINWGQAVILRPILSAWELQQEEPDTPRTR